MEFWTFFVRLFRVKSEIPGFRRLPIVEILAGEATVLSFRLARSGYWGGDPEKVLNAPLDLVLGAAEYEGFISDYENSYMKLNEAD